MLQLKWTSVTITTNKQANDMIKLFNEIKPKIGAMDTETTGLHIVKDRPFVYQFGFIHPTEYKGYTFAVDIERQPQLAKAVISAWQKLAATLELYLGHHIIFDLHMSENIGLPYTVENMSDTMFYIRYAHDAIATKNGGPPLGLKDYAAKYIDYKAKDHDRLLQAERSQIAKDLNLKLKFRLRNCGVPPAKYGAKSYTLSVIEAIFKDPITDYTDLPDNIKACYLDWLHEDVPIYLQPYTTGLVDSNMIPYNTLNRENLIRYAHYDIVFTLEVFLKLAPVVEARGNMRGIEIENKLILPLQEMERVGFNVNKEYIEDARIKMKNYIKERRRKMFELTGQEFTIGQHELVKNILNNDFGVKVETTNAEELDLLLSNLIRENPEHPAIEFITILQELRTLEKWYSTYIIRFLNDLKKADKLYTTIHQVATVSGRVASDFQQFPKGAILTHDGQELFHPRKMVTPSGGAYNALVYLDYSQIELRFQAFYTILVGNPDLNLCRAYMPYRCIDNTGVKFDYNNPDHINNWDKEWYLEETPETHWEPTDVHGATTQAATGLTSGTPEFKKARSEIGKRVNFAKNYGAQRAKIRQMFPKASEDEVTKINDAYYKAFPGVKNYHDYCYARAQNYSYTENLFGIRYYGVSGHKLINLLVQGSAAYYLKIKIRELYDYSKAHNIKSKWQMQIHDELSWERHIQDSPEIFFEFKKIMQNWPDTLVPIIAEMDATITTWAEKKGVDSLDELRVLIGD
jgi:DNA polymerase-1